MTDTRAVDELTKAVERLVGATDDLRKVVERLARLQQTDGKPNGGAQEPPRPTVPLLKRGKDPTLAERVEDELATGNRSRGETGLTQGRGRLGPSSKGKGNLAEWARKAREINDRLAAQGRYFGDATEIIRADRDSVV